MTIDLNQLCRQMLERGLDLVDGFVVFIFALLVDVLLELFNLLLDIVQLFSKGFGLQGEFTFNLVTLSLQAHFLLLDLRLNLVG
jgi:hypothetical protein